MLYRSAKWLVVLALTLSLGAHWALLQSAAWLSMVVSYSQEASLGEALEMTFDGEHPCQICDFVRDGKQGEKQEEVAKVEGEKKFLAEAKLAIPNPPSDFVLLSLRVDSPLIRCETPPLPPPRRSFLQSFV